MPIRLLLVLPYLASPVRAAVRDDGIVELPGLVSMASDAEPTVYSTVESFSKAKFLRRHRRDVIAGPTYAWASNEIPFQIYGGDYNFQNLIRRGIHMWEEVTCLRFVENAPSRDGIRYVLETGGESCYTEYIGRNGGYQDIIIGSECAEPHMIAHETGHALGYWHTHQRPDREDYIAINWKNVRGDTQDSFMPFNSMLHAFSIREVSPMRVPYDYGSLMHYNAVAHAIQQRDFTIVPKELKYVTTMGSERLTFLDAKVINDIYCTNACLGRTNVQCLAGGYPDPNNCAVCRCPEGLGGVDCSLLQPSNCGYEIFATDQWQSLSSPPGREAECFWRISVPEGSRIRFRISAGEFACSYSYVEIKHKIDVRLTGFRSCCYRPKEETVSDGNQIFVIYHPNGRAATFTLIFRRE